MGLYIVIGEKKIRVKLIQSSKAYLVTLDSILEILKSMVARLEFTGAELSYINNIDINEYKMSSGQLDALINQVSFSDFFKKTKAFSYRLNVPLEIIDGLYFVDIKTAVMKSVDGKNIQRKQNLME